MDTLTRLFTSRVKAQVLRLLFGLESRELHVREIARQARMNDATVRQELKHLVALRLILMRRDGNRLYVRADQAHPLFSDLHSIVLKTSGLADVLQAALRSLDIQCAFVFGSVAEAREGSDSDVDLLVVGATSLRALASHLSGPSRELGRAINPIVLTPREFVDRRRAGEHFLSTVLAGKKLFVIGADSDLATMGGKPVAEAAPAKQARDRRPARDRKPRPGRRRAK